MFRLFLPTIIRELRSLTKVILVIYVYDVLVIQININLYNMNGERLKKKHTIHSFRSLQVKTSY